MLGQRLTRLLVAPSVREGLADVSTRALVVVHDREASQVPWELLHDGSGFPALGRGLSRRYASETLTPARWRARAHARDSRVACSSSRIPRRTCRALARKAPRCSRCSHAAGVQVRLLLGEEATRTRILRALAAEPLDALHFAGHAYLRELESRARRSRLRERRGPARVRSGRPGRPAGAGVLQRVRGGAREATLPRAVRRSLRLRSRPISVAEAFLAGGVANFIGTHWPVGDAAASLFSTSLYSHLVRGDDLGAAILGVAPAAARARAGRLGRLRALRKPRLRATCVTKRSPMTRRTATTVTT